MWPGSTELNHHNSDEQARRRPHSTPRSTPASPSRGARPKEHHLCPTARPHLSSQPAQPAHGLARCTTTSADRPARGPRTWRDTHRTDSALVRPSDSDWSRSGLHQLHSTSPPVGALRPRRRGPCWLEPQPPRTCHRQAPVDTSAARTLPWPSHPDWTGTQGAVNTAGQENRPRDLPAGREAQPTPGLPLPEPGGHTRYTNPPGPGTTDRPGARLHCRDHLPRARATCHGPQAPTPGSGTHQTGRSALADEPTVTYLEPPGHGRRA